MQKSAKMQHPDYLRHTIRAVEPRICGQVYFRLQIRGSTALVKNHFVSFSTEKPTLCNSAITEFDFRK